MKKIITAAFLMSLVLSPFAIANKEVGNGGDDVGLEFRVAAQQALGDVATRLPSYGLSEAQIQELQTALDHASIIVVDDPVVVAKDGIKQDSVARNFHDPDTIEINRARWTNLSVDRIKQAIAFHELLGLLGWETTGRYAYSQKYLNQAGLDCAELCASQSPKDSESSADPIRSHIVRGAKVFREDGSAANVISVGSDGKVEIDTGDKFTRTVVDISNVAIPVSQSDIGLGDEFSSVYRKGFFSDTEVSIQGIFIDGDILVRDYYLEWKNANWSRDICFMRGGDYNRVSRSRLYLGNHSIDFECGVSGL